MPSDDLILNVRQVGGYPPAFDADPTDSLLIQRGGLGGPYFSLSPSALVSTALAAPGADMTIGGQLAVGDLTCIGLAQAASLSANDASIAVLDAGVVEVDELTVGGVPAATEADIQNVMDATVHSFMGRRGDVRLWLEDIVCAGGAPIFSPRFSGSPRAETPAPWSHSTRLATTAFVHRNSVEYITKLLKDHPFVFTFNGRSGDIVLTPEDIGNVEGALLNSPALQGTPTAPTAPPLTNSDQLATTAYVDSAVATAGSAAQGALDTAINGLADIYAPINSPSFTGYATAPTPEPGTSNAQLATTSFVMGAITSATAGVSSFNTRTGAVTLEAADITAAGGALLTSPVFNGTPQAPTAAAGNNSNQIATTAWVLNEIGGAAVGVMTFNGRGGAVVLTSADLTSAGGALLASPALTGVPTAPTAASGTSTQQIATTAFVESAISAVSTGVISFNGREGAITLTANDISAAGGLINPSAALTGVPTAPTATPGVSTTQIATTAFVTAAIAAGQGVSSFNTRTGAITLTGTDITNAGGVLTPAMNTAISTALAAYLPLTGGTINGGSGLTIAGTQGLNVTASNGVSISGTNGLTVSSGGISVTGSTGFVGVSMGLNVGGSGINCQGDLTATGGVGLNTNGASFTNIGFVSQLVQASASCNIENPYGQACQVMSSYNGPSANGIAVRNDRTDGNSIVFLFGQSTIVGRISQNGSTTSYITTSDYRMKTVHGYAGDVGAMIDAVPVYDAEFKQPGAPVHSRMRAVTPAVATNKRRFPMFLAHELQQLCPWAVDGVKDAVNEDGSINPQGVDASKLVALMWAEIQNLRRRLTAVEANYERSPVPA